MAEAPVKGKKVQETPEERQKRLTGLLKTSPNEFWVAATISDARRIVPGKDEMTWAEYVKAKGDGVRAYWLAKPEPNQEPTTAEEAKKKLAAQIAKYQKQFPGLKV